MCVKNRHEGQKNSTSPLSPSSLRCFPVNVGGFGLRGGGRKLETVGSVGIIVGSDPSSAPFRDNGQRAARRSGNRGGRMRRRLSSYARSLARVKDLCGRSLPPLFHSSVRSLVRQRGERTRTRTDDEACAMCERARDGRDADDGCDVAA